MTTVPSLKGLPYLFRLETSLLARIHHAPDKQYGTGLDISNQENEGAVKCNRHRFRWHGCRSYDDGAGGGQVVASSLIPGAAGAGSGAGAAGGALAGAAAPVILVGIAAGAGILLAEWVRRGTKPEGPGAKQAAAGGLNMGRMAGSAGNTGTALAAGQWGAAQAKVLADEARRAKAVIDKAIVDLGAASATQSGKAFTATMKQVTQLRELAAKKIPLGNIDKEHTDAELRTTRDRIATSLGITIKEADALMKTMFKDWRPQDVLKPAINQAAAATEKRIAQLRREAAKDIRMGGVNAEKLLNEIGKVTSAFSGMRDQARQAANAAANALQRRRGLQGGGHIDKGGGFQMASGGWVAPRPGGLAVVLAEGGEGEYVVPESKVGRFAQAALGGGAAPAAPTHATVIERHVTLTWQTLTGEPSTREKQRLAAWLKPELDGMGARVTGTGFRACTGPPPAALSLHGTLGRVRTSPAAPAAPI